MYMQDDMENLKDSFTMQLTDGCHTVQGTTKIIVLPVNDEKPWLLKNAGVEVDCMDRKVISGVVWRRRPGHSSQSDLLYPQHWAQVWEAAAQDAKHDPSSNDTENQLIYNVVPRYTLPS
ncbi:FRAS1-related extracellular matrix protein 1 [Salmo salar]|uniref:FRAS1-related extracellular matrix protein 1 n=1 Tax=Salmo salar TaxID=8030 RepID=A0A1S3MPT1_SALSA|nr:FRAS1-related extracellular matrix protein 1-like [Salmo salar]